MSKLLVIEDGIIIQNIDNHVFWDGLFSKTKKNGQIIKYIQSLLADTNSIMVIPHSDGNIFSNVNIDEEYNDTNWQEIQIYIDKAKQFNKVFILGTVAQVNGKENDGINYLYLPQDDIFFEHGVTPFFTNIDWIYKSNELIWRGGCSGPKGNKSLRVRFVEKLYKKHPNVRLSNWWSEGKNIPNELFGSRINYTEFIKNKIHFIIEGNGISSNMMWGFATNSVPVLITKMKCWFSEFLIENVHFISVKYDLSDLDEKITWIINNDDKAEQIAKNAYNFSKQIFSSEFQKNYLKTKLESFIYDFKKQNSNQRNILTIFAGRKSNLEILIKYLQKALNNKIIDEVHLWNNTKNIDDENYINTITNLKRTSSSNLAKYITITPVIINNSFDLFIEATNDIHIKINEYEIVIGGWNNTKSVIRTNNKEIYSLDTPNIIDKLTKNKYTIKIINTSINIYINDNKIIECDTNNKFNIERVELKTGFNCSAILEYDTINNKGFYLMDTCEKSWKNYYNFYNRKEYVNDIILKCDDDIVFIDLLKLPKFIDFIKINNYDLVFANTINNGVSAYYQQNKYNLIPKELLSLEYPNGGFCGTLWESGKKAEQLHNYFIENTNKFLDYEYNNDIIQIITRFSINFFGFKGSKWNQITDVYNDDEHNLTVNATYKKGFKNIFYSDFYVSHLSFYKQIETGINITNLQEKYNKLFYTMEKNRFATLL